jgi:hypothetical protein
MRYTDASFQWHEYSCQSGDFDVINDLAALFFRDVDLCLAEVEVALRSHGIVVTRTPTQSAD